MEELISILKEMNKISLLDVIAIIAPLILSVVAIGISISTARKQNKITLFEKKYKVYVFYKYTFAGFDNLVRFPNRDYATIHDIFILASESLGITDIADYIFEYSFNLEKLYMLFDIDNGRFNAIMVNFADVLQHSFERIAKFDYERDKVQFQIAGNDLKFINDIIENKELLQKQIDKMYAELKL